jgi:hypothetical protein
MEVGNTRRATAAQHLLAGLETGVVAALAMLAWLGLSAVWYRHSFWTAPNLLASTFYGEFALGHGFTGRTLSRLALYLLVYGSLGMLFGLAIQNRSAGLRINCIGILGAIAWYYLLFDLVWRTWNPLLALYTQDRPMFAGHVLFGIMLGRYPGNLRALLPKSETVPVEAGDPLPAPDRQP